MSSLTESATTYVLPVACQTPVESAEFRDYLAWLGARVEVIVVDGSPDAVFRCHERSWGKIVRHVRPDEDLVTPMGKVGGVLTGVRLASNERIVIADDDVRYGMRSLAAVAGALERSDVVRPQNYFSPLRWHSLWDTARILLNRATGGDWPGTLAVRKSTLDKAGGYDGSVMFENLELVRTVIAAGGTELVAKNIFVRRIPSTSAHFLSQRVRQAYDELARPRRLMLQLAILPAVVALAITKSWLILAMIMVGVIAAAEIGRRQDGAERYFPAASALFAPLWCLERGLCIWIALGSRIVRGGIRYRGGILRRAATPLSELRERHGNVRQARPGVMARETPRRRSA